MSPTVSLQLLQSFGPLLIVVAIALVVLAFQLYRGRSGALLALRLGAILLVVLLLLEPVLAFFSEHSGPPRIAVLVDTSLSMSIPFPAGSDAETGNAEAAPPTRADRLRDFLTESRLVQRLEDHGPTDVYRFGGTVEALDPEAGPLDVEPRDDRTDVARALDEGDDDDEVRDGEFVCQSCFLVKRSSQLANRRKMICRDCAD